jgi:hypothetical protein
VKRPSKKKKKREMKSTAIGCHSFQELKFQAMTSDRFLIIKKKKLNHKYMIEHWTARC